jgi:hypothetical protein
MTVPSSQRLCHSASAHIAAARRRGKWNNTDSIIVDRLYGRLALGDTVHIVEDEVVLAEMHRACRHGGGIILTVRQHRWLWSGTDEVAHHVRRYQAGELRRKVEAAGFSLICSTSFMTLLLPMLLAARLGPRRQARALSAELAISALAQSASGGNRRFGLRAHRGGA